MSKSKVFQFRLSQSEMDRLKDGAKRSGLSAGRYLVGLVERDLGIRDGVPKKSTASQLDSDGFGHRDSNKSTSMQFGGFDLEAAVRKNNAKIKGKK